MLLEIIDVDHQQAKGQTLPGGAVQKGVDLMSIARRLINPVRPSRFAWSCSFRLAYARWARRRAATRDMAFIFA